MKNLLNIRFLAAIFAVAFVFGVVETFAQTYTVERGTVIRVRMNETLSSRTARAGDRFTTTVTEPVYSNTGQIVIPVGSTLTGRVDSVNRAKKGGDPGTIDVSFTEVRLPNGTRRSMNGSLTGLTSDDAKSDNEGRASGDDRKNDKIIFIGGGAAGGAILGGLIGGGKGAVIGGILGGLAGLGGERLTRGEEAEVKSGMEFGVILNQRISLPRFGATDERYDRPTSAGGRTYIVQRGDTLAKISQRFYGNTRGYWKIYEANRDKLASPSQVEVGQELIIP
ncbi:MAG TPA: LysM peptidoglycan-binding domain-containing protein [Pyrinomonadaceae bacterium]|nr:LysM peptidoglycan-binding domain-containing protein [Pyrinomonadaceae bacterium]